MIEYQQVGDQVEMLHEHYGGLRIFQEDKYDLSHQKV